MSSLGERLRQARLAKGIDLAAIAAETCIGTRYLEALESGRHDDLPGAIFAKNFARQYASHVGLSLQEIEEDLQAAFPSPQPPPTEIVQPPQPIQVAPLRELQFFSTTSLRRMGASLAGLVVAIVGGAMAFKAYQELPALIAKAREDAKVQQQAEERRPAEPAAPAVDASPASVIPASGAAPPEPENTTTINISGSGMAVQLIASEKTWVSLRANGKVIFSGILQPNQRKIVEGVERATLVVGNAGGVQVMTNGKDIGPIGPPGQVRVVLLSPDGSQIMKKNDDKAPARTSTD